MFTNPQSNQECFRIELSVQSLTFPIVSPFWLDTETKQRPPLMLSKNILSFPPTACHLYSCPEEKHIKKQR